MKLAAGSLISAIRMFFANEDILAVHTVSRAAFRILYDITMEGEAKVVLDAHIKKVGVDRFNEETNFLKHADRDPDGEIDDKIAFGSNVLIVEPCDEHNDPIQRA